MQKEIQKLIAPILAAGGEIRPGRKHPVLILPSGKRTGIPNNIGEKRAIHNLRSRLNKLLETNLITA